MDFFWSEFSQAKGPQANFVHQRTAPWEQFLAEKMQFAETTNKANVWLWSPTKYKPGATRGKNGVTELSALVYDFDDKSDEFMIAIRQNLSGIEHIFHTSFSHLSPGKGNRFRVIVPFARAATRKEWKATQISFAKNHGFLWEDDAQTRHEATIFYWPSCPPGSPRILEHVSGRLTQVETNTAGISEKQSKTAETGGLLTGTPGYDDNFIHRWATSEKGSDAHLWYGKLKAGLPVAAMGARDGAVQAAVWAICNRMTNDQLHLVDEAVVLDFMAKSIAATPGLEDDKLTPDQVREKLRRARRDVLFERTGGLNTKEEHDAFLTALTSNVQEAPEVARASIKPAPAAAKWTETDIAEISSEYFCGGKIKPVLFSEKSFFVFTKEKGFSHRLASEYVGSYGVREGLANCGIEAIGIKRGETFVRSGKEILDAYPSQTDIVAHTRGSFIGHSQYDAESNTFTEVVNPIRQVEPVKDLEIDAFLRAYCAKPRDYDHLLAWLKRFPNLNLPNNVLFVYGPKNIGKSLIGIALARFWGRENGIQPFNFFATFQDAFVDCPFILADEGLPKDMVNSNQIRTFATTGEHMVNRKHMPAVRWTGYARMLINANNVDELKFSKDVLNQESIEAIEARFLRIEVSEKIRLFISERGGRAWTETLVAGDRFIKHVQWLAQNHQHPPLSTDARFPAMTDPENRMHDTARLDQLLSEPLCSLIWSCLKKNGGGPTLDAWKNRKILWREIQGKPVLCVASSIVEPELWRVVTEGQNVPKPSPRRTGDTLRLLSDASIKTNDGGYQVKDIGRFWPIDSSLLRKWATQSGVPEVEIESLLSGEKNV